MKTTLLILFLSFGLSLQAFADEGEEDISPAATVVPYHDDSSIFDETRIHVGVSLIQSMQDYLIAPGVRERGGLRGFELGLGIDLFSPAWQVEGTVMNFPQDSISDTQLSMTGFELRLLYEKPVFYGITVHGGFGLGNRVYNLKTKARPDLSVAAQDRSFSSGATVLAFGADYWPSGEVSAGVEVTDHLPMATGDDPSSIDFSVRLTGHF